MVVRVDSKKQEFYSMMKNKHNSYWRPLLLLIITLCGTSWWAYSSGKLTNYSDSILHNKTKSTPTASCNQNNITHSQDVIVERVITRANPWSEVQSKVKNTVVQVFSQIAEFDWLQPYATPKQGQSSGTAFFIDSSGLLLTNAHVVNQAKAILVQIPTLGKHQFEVDLLGISFDRDLALLKLRPDDYNEIIEQIGTIPVLELGDSNRLRRGDEVMALGYPLGQQSLKSTTGVISGVESLGRQLIQIDAAINPGNSGGPAINPDGHVIGINTANVPSAQNVGYIIPINEVKIIIDDLKDATQTLVRKPFLGIFYNVGSSTLTQYLGNPLPGGTYITDVYKGSLLDKVGVKQGDMIYEINGLRIDMHGDVSVPWDEDKISLVDYLPFLKLGQEISLIVYRNGTRKEFNFTFTESKLPSVRVMYPDFEEIDYEVIGGMVIMQLTRNHLPLLIQSAPELIKFDEAKNQAEPTLVVTHVLPASHAQRSRAILTGTRIAEINGTKVKTLTDLRKALKKSLASDFLIVKSSNDVLVAFPFKKLLSEEAWLSRLYHYPISESVQALIDSAGSLKPQIQPVQKNIHQSTEPTELEEKIHEERTARQTDAATAASSNT
jgi:serine protease Do